MRHIFENLNNYELKYPDCVALCFDPNECVLSAIYNDHSFYVWDIKELDKVKKLDSHLFHSSCCWSIDIFSSLSNVASSMAASSNLNSSNTSLPTDSFITCSADNTLRIWSPMSSNNNNSNSTSTAHNLTSTTGNSPMSPFKLRKNIYSKELLKIIYIDNDLSALCEVDLSLDEQTNNVTTSQTSAAVVNNSNTLSQSYNNSVTNLPVSSITSFNYDSSSGGGGNAVHVNKTGARCVKISPQGRHLASGDRNGNIKIYDMITLESICVIEAHDGEVLCLQYSQPEAARLLLASSSRDRLIHIFDASKHTYDLMQTLDDHSAAITAVRFFYNQFEKQLYVISCGSDKSIMIRTTASNNYNSNGNGSSSIEPAGSSSSSSSPSISASSSMNFATQQQQQTTQNNSAQQLQQQQQIQFARSSYVAEKQSFYDLSIDSSKNQIYTISQDRMIRAYSIKDGKRLRQFKGSLNEDGYLLKMDMDRAGNLLATSCTDKCVYIWDLNTGDCVAYICGHSEVVTDLKFTSDNQHLITVSGDGCLFIWRLSNLHAHLPPSSSASTISANGCLSSIASRKTSLSIQSTSNATSTNTLAGVISTPTTPTAFTSLTFAPPSTSLASPVASSTLNFNHKLNAEEANKLDLLSNSSSFTIESQTAAIASTNFDNIFDDEDEEALLPAWARNKLKVSNSSSKLDAISPKGSFSLEAKQEKQIQNKKDKVGEEENQEEDDDDEDEEETINEIFTINITKRINPVKGDEAKKQVELLEEKQYDYEEEISDEKSTIERARAVSASCEATMSSNGKRASRAVWGPPVLNATFADMYENGHNGISETISYTSASASVSAPATPAASPTANNSTVSNIVNEVLRQAGN
jgi:WD40 repeat protein